jgi:hypothetical protein
VIRRDRRAIAASLLVCFMYGTLAWGVLPINPAVSWETHLSAALIGVALALVFRDRDNPPRVRYSWEDETEEFEGVQAETGQSTTGPSEAGRSNEDEARQQH